MWIGQESWSYPFSISLYPHLHGYSWRLGHDIPMDLRERARIWTSPPLGIDFNFSSEAPGRWPAGASHRIAEDMGIGLKGWAHVIAHLWTSMNMNHQLLGWYYFILMNIYEDLLSTRLMNHICLGIIFGEGDRGWEFTTPKPGHFQHTLQLYVKLPQTTSRKALTSFSFIHT